MSNRTGKMWEYLESTGVLENGTDEEIKFAKKTYRKEYLLKYKQEQRKSKPEFTVNFSNNGEYDKVQREAERHKMTITRFIHQAVLAYISQTFVVPYPEQIAYLEQILSDCLNQIQSIVKPKEKYHWESQRKLEEIEKKITALEEAINNFFRNPPLQKNDSQSQNI